MSPTPRGRHQVPPHLVGLLAVTSVAWAIGCGTSSSTMPPASPPTCASYCSDVTTSCTGANLQYADPATCLTYCNRALTAPTFWTQGVTGTTSGNSLACRDAHAGLAVSSPGPQCPSAGPIGGGNCGGLCEDYCAVAAAVCTGADQLYVDNASCLTACAAFPTDGAVGSTSGNTLQCRMYFLDIVATGSSAALHCPHASPTSTICI